MLKNRISLLGFLLAAASMVGLVFTHHLFATSPLLRAVQVAAAALMLWARTTFGLRSFHASASASQGGLVTTGPYRYWRHPIYASIIYFVWTGQVEAPALMPLALASVVTIGLVARMLLEEQFLALAYPEYPSYARKAKRLIPGVF